MAEDIDADKIILKWHEIKDILYLVGKSMDETDNPFIRQGKDALFQKLYPLYELDPLTEFIIQQLSPPTS